MSGKAKKDIEKTARQWAKRLAETMKRNEPAAEAEHERREAERDAGVSKALAEHLRGARRPK